MGVAAHVTSRGTVRGSKMVPILKSKTGPLRFGSENRFPLNFAHENILV